MQPAAGPPGSRPQVYGVPVKALDDACNASQRVEGLPTCVGQVLLGKQLLLTEAEDAGSVYQRSWNAQRQSGWFQVNASLPVPTRDVGGEVRAASWVVVLLVEGLLLVGVVLLVEGVLLVGVVLLLGFAGELLVLVLLMLGSGMMQGSGCERLLPPRCCCCHGPDHLPAYPTWWYHLRLSLLRMRMICSQRRRIQQTQCHVTTLPHHPTPHTTTPMQAVPEVGTGTAGRYNVSLRFDGIDGGAAALQRGAYQADRTGAPFMYQVYPEVDAVVPSSGSAAGGTLLTITGRGFPEKGFSPDDSLSVNVGGQPCEVVSSSYASIVCRTSARPSGTGAEVPLAGSYTGMRGVQFDIFPR